MPEYIDHDRLVLGDAPIGKGGQGRVWEVKDRLINGRWPVVFKEYVSPRDVDTDVLEEMVAFVPKLPTDIGEWWCERSSWPAAVVARAGRPVGFLMRRIPDEYYIRLAFDQGNRVPAGFEFLLNPANYLQRVGISLSDLQRAELLRDLAHVLDRLHRRRVVVGDLSPANVMFSLAGKPSCYFLDCDAMRLRGRDVLPQVETPHWGAPDSEPKATVASDRYKFALMAVRLFAGDQHTEDITALTGFSTELGHFAKQALHHGPEQRPTMKAWVSALDKAAEDAATTPRPKPTSPKPNPTPPPPNPGPYVPPHPHPHPQPQMPPIRPTPPGKPSSGRRVAAVLTIIAMLFFFAYLAHKGGEHGYGTDPGSTASPTSGPTAAQAIDSLLAEAKATRGTVDSAAQDAMNCGAPAEDATAFGNALTERRDLLRRLSDLNVDALDGGSAVVSDLTNAWQASANADDYFQRWASSLTGTCTSDSTSSDYENALAQGQLATAAKKRFVADWTPIAQQYGLPAYSWDEL
ncbi:hypothetical protein [Streptomyces silvisoli]|uniref:Protein kinase domain-containing protein n=1 Tax=Streptomyces silvisoli TaxID=3034235 RepID=A0ABT5ZLL8_9ACTN|nr:hypothetical protein [Streptomyces silvisoli]MDF3290720.1 hypothetical protein [Streptomyces silvisoli]